MEAWAWVWVQLMVPPGLLMLQAHVAMRLAFCRHAWDCMHFECLLLAATPGAAIWLTPRGWLSSLTAPSVPKLLAEAWQQPQTNSKQWLQDWANTAFRATNTRRQQEAAALLIVASTVVTAFVAFSCVEAEESLVAVGGAALLVMVDIALVTGDDSPALSSLLVMTARMPLCFPQLEPVLQHALVVVLAGLRLGATSTAESFPSHLLPTARGRALQQLLLLGQRPDVFPKAGWRRWVPGRRVVSLAVLLAALAGEVYVVFSAHPSPRPPAPPPPIPPPVCQCHFPYVYEGETHSTCTKEGDSEPWCFISVEDFSWGYCGVQGRHGSEVLGYSGTNLCLPPPPPPPPPRPLPLPNPVRYSWCIATLQQRSAALLIAILVLGITVTGAWRALTYNKYHTAPNTCAWLVLASGVASCLQIFMLDSDCHYAMWGLNHFPEAKFQRIVLGQLSLWLGVIFYAEWHKRHFRSARLPGALFFLTLTMVAVESPFGVRWLDMTAVALGCAFAVWSSFFAVGGRVVPLAAANLVVGLFADFWLGAQLHLFLDEIPEEGEPLLDRWGLKDASLVAASAAMTGPLLFAAALKGTQLAQDVRAQADGLEGSESSAAIPLYVVCALAGVDLSLFALTARSWLILVLGWLALLHAAVLVWHCSRAGQGGPYPKLLQQAWVVLLFLCAAASSFLWALDPRVGASVACASVEVHLVIIVLIAQLSMSHVPQRELQGPFSHGVRSTHHCSSLEYDDRVKQLPMVSYASLGAALAGVAWSLVTVLPWLGPAAGVTAALVHLNLLALWRHHCASVCNVPGWAVEAKAAWAAKESTIVWCPEASDLPPHSKLLQFLEERGREVARLEREAVRASLDHKQAASTRKELILSHEEAICGILEWEMRFGRRLERAADREGRQLLTVAASLQVEAEDVNDLLRLPEKVWDQLLSARRAVRDQGDGAATTTLAVHHGHREGGGHRGRSRGAETGAGSRELKAASEQTRRHRRDEGGGGAERTKSPPRRSAKDGTSSAPAKPHGATRSKEVQNPRTSGYTPIRN